MRVWLGMVVVVAACSGEKPADDAADTAVDGDSGDTGDSGDPGDTGDSGDSGDTGDSGDSGDTGDSGDSGDSGDTGDTGTSRDRDGDGYGAGVDCDDESSAIHPGADERCNGLDDDCDGDVDERPIDPDPYYADADADGYGDPTTEVYACEPPEGFVDRAGDCDDAAVDVNPAADEVCDGVDDDCDGETDEAGADGELTWYADADADGYGDPAVTVDACEAPEGFVADDQDCDDGDAAIHPDTVWYGDGDGDGHGDPASTTTGCLGPAGAVLTADDCDDGAADVHPGATEVCDARLTDEDCDGVADDDDPSTDPATRSTWYLDLDHDGYGDTAASACHAPSGHVALGGDCDDGDADVHPGATEVCDAADVDEDCDGAADDADGSVDLATASTWYADADADGYGGAATTLACDAPAGHVARGGDCDDAAAGVNPGAAEACDAADTDEDCDGVADDLDADAAGAVPWYRDADRDGQGDPAVSRDACDAPVGYVANADDCDDTDAGTFLGGTEVCGEAGADEDCDGLVDEADPDLVPPTWYADADADGYGDAAVPTAACSAPTGHVADATDCDDTHPDVFPGAPERYGDDVDDDCDGATDPEVPTCVGVEVPGDYATITAALAAHEPSICLAAGTYAESPTCSADCAIQGRGQGVTILAGRLATSTAYTTDVAWLTLASGIQGLTSGSLRHVTATCDGGETKAIDGGTWRGLTVELDAVDASCAASRGSAVELDNIGSQDDSYLYVTNSYFHDAYYLWKLSTYVSSSDHATPYTVVSNVLFENAGFAAFTIQWAGSSSYDAYVALENNVYVDNNRALSESLSGGIVVTAGPQAFYGNTTDFYGEAAAGADDLFDDPLLDTSFVPPRYDAGSPLYGAGSATYLPATDYWGVARDSGVPQLGPVEP